MENSLTLDLLTLLIVIIIGLALRPVYNWYCKQDELLKTNEKILEELRMIRSELIREKTRKEEQTIKAER